MKKLVILAAMFSLAVGVALAQPPNEPPGGPDPNGPDPLSPAIPVDGGASLLMFAGATFGARKLRAGMAKKA
jgi:hypothetical protein